MELQAEVTGGGEGAKFALKRLASVLVLMYLVKGDRFVSNHVSSLAHREERQFNLSTTNMQ